MSVLLRCGSSRPNVRAQPPSDINVNCLKIEKASRPCRVKMTVVYALCCSKTEHMYDTVLTGKA